MYSVALLCFMLASSCSQALAEQGNSSITARNHFAAILVGENATLSFEVLVGNNSTKDSVELYFAETPVGVIDPLGNITLSSLSSFNVTVRGASAGKTLLNVSATDTARMIDVKDGFVIVSVFNSRALQIASDVVGWAYFVAWSVSFYPQIYENWKRKSVIGLNFDFLSLNIVGFFLYSVFNIFLYSLSSIQKQYFEKHPQGVNPVQLNDVIFAFHAFAACFITIVQCWKYERGGQSVSRPCRLLHCVIFALLFISLIVALASALSWLNFLYICSYVKLFITLIKYCPQAYMNYTRKSTLGWSIGNVLLDFSGGFLSIAQMFMIAYNNDDWSSIFGDPTKFGLGLFSVLFDIFFMLQHYVFYRNNVPHQALLIDNVMEEDERSLQSND